MPPATRHLTEDKDAEGFDFLGHADLWIMPTWPGISLSQAAISPIVSA